MSRTLIPLLSMDRNHRVSLSRRTCAGTAPRAGTPLSPLRLAAEALLLEGGEVVAPASVVLDAEPVQVLPGKNPGIVQIVKFDAHRVIADRLQVENADMGALGDDALLAGAVPLHLGRRALDAQILGRQAELLAVVEFDLEPLCGAFQPQFDRPRSRVAHNRALM